MSIEPKASECESMERLVRLRSEGLRLVIRSSLVTFILTPMYNDLRYAIRMFRKNPGFTAEVVLTLALGIGGTTAIFSVLYGAVLNPLPYWDSHRLIVLIAHDATQSPDVANWAYVSLSEFLDYREQSHVFEEVFTGIWENLHLTGTGTAERLYGRRVTDNAFRALGVPPLIGRPITPEDCKPGAPPVVVLSHNLWQRSFGGDTAIVGRTIILNHQPTTVVGIMPPRFQFLEGEVWLPGIFSRGATSEQGPRFCVIGRLRSGVTVEQAKADCAVLAGRMALVYPKEHPRGVRFEAEPMIHSIVKFYQLTHYILMGAVGSLLLIACVNVANLLLSRATAHARELAIRSALGASRVRLFRQLMVESLLLALAGAVLGSLFAWNALDGLRTIVPGSIVSTESVIRINGAVLLFTFGAALLCALLFGLAPALFAVRKDVQEPLKASGRGVGESLAHGKLRSLLVMSEVALALVLVTGGGLLIRSFFAVRYAEFGYNPDNVLEMGTWLPEERYKTAEQRNQFQMEALRRLRALPGVVSAAGEFPAISFGWSAPIEILGKPRVENQTAWSRLSSDRLVETLEIRLLRGRDISQEDVVRARKVAVVNRAFVSKYFGSENPLGRQFRLPQADKTFPQTWFAIVGVVADTRHSEGPEPTVAPQMFFPYTVGGIPHHIYVVRTVGDAGRLANAVRRTIADMDKEVIMFGPKKIRDWMASNWYPEPRFVLTMLVAFGLLGLVLVSVGIYSVLSYAVSRRTQEIGIRMALGADATDVRRMVMTSGLRWLGVGIGIGVPASIALAKVLQNRIWGIKSADPLTLGAVTLLLTLVGLAACYFPARRATKVDPIVALRYE